MRFVNISTKSLQITKGVAHKHFFDKDARPSTNFSHSKKWNDSKLKPKKKKKEWPKTQAQKIHWLKMQIAKIRKKWVMRIDFSVTISYYLFLRLCGRLSVYCYVAWLKMLTVPSVDYWEGFWGLLHT